MVLTGFCSLDLEIDMLCEGAVTAASPLLAAQVLYRYDDFYI